MTILNFLAAYTTWFKKAGLLLLSCVVLVGAGVAYVYFLAPTTTFPVIVDRFLGRSQLPAPTASFEADALASRNNDFLKASGSVFASNLKPLYGAPVRLYTSKSATPPVAKLDLDLVEVDVLPDGKLETPKEWLQGGWYAKSSMPGQLGNMIINAHYDDNLGRPAGFWELKNLQVGDTVYVQDVLGRVYAYVVSELFYIDIQDPARLKIFDEVKTKKELTLITCGGFWTQQYGYNKRLVVKAQL